MTCWDCSSCVTWRGSRSVLRSGGSRKRPELLLLIDVTCSHEEPPAPPRSAGTLCWVSYADSSLPAEVETETATFTLQVSLENHIFFTNNYVLKTFPPPKLLFLCKVWLQFPSHSNCLQTTVRYPTVIQSTNPFVFWAQNVNVTISEESHLLIICLWYFFLGPLRYWSTSTVQKCWTKGRTLCARTTASVKKSLRHRFLANQSLNPTGKISWDLSSESEWVFNVCHTQNRKQIQLHLTWRRCENSWHSRWECG